MEEIPEYLLPPIAKLNNTERLQSILERTDKKDFVRTMGVQPGRCSFDQIKDWIGTLERKFPQ